MAKGMAQGLGIPVIGISTLEVLAYQQRRFRGLIRPILNAGRGEVATALFRVYRGNWRRVEEDRLSTWRRSSQDGAAHPVLRRDLASAAEQISRRPSGRAVVAGEVASWRRAGFLAELASQRLQAGGAGQADALEPVYLRRPSIGGSHSRAPAVRRIWANSPFNRA